MSKRFYAGPISAGMGRRWDDWREPEAGVETPPRSQYTPRGRTPASRSPLPPVSAGTRPARIEPVIPRR